jgi:hypothetical protein
MSTLTKMRSNILCAPDQVSRSLSFSGATFVISPKKSREPAPSFGPVCLI